MTHTYEDWKNAKYPGNMMIESPEWLTRGCACCGSKEWHVTGDGWAYCLGCDRGFSTNGLWLHGNRMSYFGPTGWHCWYCKGWGTRDGEICNECYGRVERW